MARTIDDFWKIWNEIVFQNTDLTEALKAIARSEQGSANQLFNTVIDQIAYNSPDYQRMRSFMRDWYASHRTLTTFQQNISDIYEMPNDQLDDLFQSFGYDYSASIRNPIDNEPLLIKSLFFLDLVNLYKVKGTPQSLVDVLQYNGIGELDVYEFDLQFDDRPDKDPTDLMFKGVIAAGTTGDTSPLYLPYSLLTLGDPHWLQTESQIRHLQTINKIDFPSRAPYFAIKPLFDERGLEGGMSILVRTVQDQYQAWMETGIPPTQDAASTITGDQVSLLALYLSCLYMFNKQFSVGTPGKSFICYDGTDASNVIQILDEYDTLTGRIEPFTRIQQTLQLTQYYDQFSRVTPRNFLQNSSDAATLLAVLNPTFKNNLDLLGTTDDIILGSLLADLGEWIRANISAGFINISYILFGIDSLFLQLREIIEFFKPYRARLIPIEMIEFRSRLMNTIIVEDTPPGGKDNPFIVEKYIHDFYTGMACGEPCCADDSTALCSLNPRQFYDCGSWHDIGSVTDGCRELEIDYGEDIHDHINCVPAVDSTAIVTSIINTDTTTVYFIDATTSETIVQPIDYYQSGGFADFDYGGTLDCTHGFDLVNVEVVEVVDYLVQQSGDRILQQNGDGIRLNLGF